jgi:predicted nuclease with TOPRIM domain
VKEINRDWESRCRALEERTKIFDIEKSKLEDELKRVTERQVDIKIRHEEELRELTRRVE